MTRWVADASPLIFLAKLDRLDLLRRSTDELYAPSRVLAEIREQDDASTLAIDQAVSEWIRIADPPGLAGTMRTGEAAVIALAVELRADRVVMDDLAARKWARQRGLQVVGTMGLLLAARLNGELASLQEEIERLRRHGFHASDDLVQAVLAAVGEIPP